MQQNSAPSALSIAKGLAMPNIGMPAGFTGGMPMPVVPGGGFGMGMMGCMGVPAGFPAIPQVCIPLILFYSYFFIVPVKTFIDRGKN